MCEEIERQVPGALVATYVVDGDRLVPRIASEGFTGNCFAGDIGASAGMPAAPWSRAVCGTRMMISEDMTDDASCACVREALLRENLRSGWFVPVVAPIGRTVGLLAVCHRVACRPHPGQRAALRRIAALVAVAVQRDRFFAENRVTTGRLKNLMENVPGVVFQWTIGRDRTFALPFISDSAESITGLRALDVVRRPRLLFGRIPRADRRNLIRALRRSASAMEAVTEDFRIDCGDKGVRWFRVISRPQRMANGAIVSDALCLDVSDSRAAEETLRKSQNELNERILELHRTKARLETQSTVLMETARELTEARDAAEQASRAKSEFLSNMSHELRTPLNAIIGFSEIIREQTFGPVGSSKYREYASDIFVSGQHLLELINEILDFAKIEAGKEELRIEVVRLHEAVDSVLHMVHERAERAGLVVTADVPSDLPPLQADNRKIRQVLLNLLSNAIKFTERGGRISITAWCSANAGFVVQVADTGIGIALEDIPKALGVFGQIDSAFNRRHEGTGLGLPLSKALVEMHGGSLDLQSQPGVGTTVTIRLPAERIVRGMDSVAARAG